MKKEIKVVVFEEESEWDLPKEPIAFMKYWTDKFYQIPPEFKDTARVEVEANSFYDGAILSVEVSYRRPETDEEVQKRMEDQTRADDRQKQQELRQIDALRKKYSI